MSATTGLSPATVWKHFEALSAIPRVSGNEKAAADYVCNFAASLGLEVKRDEGGNVLVRKAASPGFEGLVRVVLQSHLDMVGQKTQDSAHDFARDPLKLKLEGEWLRAEGTTLGADNGIGVAVSLALLESTSISHGPLSALFTVEEEIGLRGAARTPREFLEGSVLINMDSDDPANLIIGCAGALDLRVDFPVQRAPLPLGWCGVAFTLSGLLGGHSGGDIDRGRGNALKLLARVLDEAGRSTNWLLSSFTGGDARNAIPREAKAQIALPADQYPFFRAQLDLALRRVQEELAFADPRIQLSFEPVTAPSRPLVAASSESIIAFLRACPTGVARTSDTHPGVVETSGNLAVFLLADESDKAHCQLLLRSLVDSAKTDLADSIRSLARLAGGRPTVCGDYPGWAPDPRTRIAPLFEEITKEVIGQPPRVAVIHAGLECGILRALNPTLDCVSCGARIESMHSPDERVHVPSVADLFEIVSRALSRVPRG